MLQPCRRYNRAVLGPIVGIYLARKGAYLECMHPMRVLLVEDRVDILDLFEHILMQRGHDVTACADGESAWQAYDEKPFELVLLDWELRASGMDGLQLCRMIRSSCGGDRCVIVMVTAHDSSDALQKALQAGVNDYLVKPVGSGLLRLRLTIAEQWVESVRRRFKSEDHAQDLQAQLAAHGTFHDLIGQTLAMKQLYNDILAVATTDTPVLIEGETGTGKDLVARAIHLSSRRASQSFLTVHCGNSNDSSFARGGFGIEPESLVSASGKPQGWFQATGGGTIFLDEIGDGSLTLQASILRMLVKHDVRGMDGLTPDKVDTRVVAATHHHLEQDVEKGTFRRDLLYRIKGVRLHLTPLRERLDDIPVLVRAFLGQFRSVMGKPVLQVDPEALQVLREYAWPGNVRELKNAVESSMLHCTGTIVRVDDLPAEIRDSGSRVSYVLRKYQAERTRMLGALQETNGNRSEAARLLGMSRRTFYRRLAEYNVRKIISPTDIAPS